MENDIPEYQLVWAGKASHVCCLFAKVYTLSDLNGDVFYVGITTGTLERRLTAHLCDARIGKGNAKKNERIILCQFKPKISQVDIMYVTGYNSSMAMNKARFLEYEWICRFRDQGMDLANSRYVPEELDLDKKHILSDLESYLKKTNTHE
jgi:hypothetical protein